METKIISFYSNSLQKISSYSIIENNKRKKISQQDTKISSWSIYKKYKEDKIEIQIKYIITNLNDIIPEYSSRIQNIYTHPPLFTINFSNPLPYPLYPLKQLGQLSFFRNEDKSLDPSFKILSNLPFPRSSSRIHGSSKHRDKTGGGGLSAFWIFQSDK